MSSSFPRSTALAGLLAGTAVVAVVAVEQPVIAKSARDVARVAVPTTVQINNTLQPDRSGSGVIIAKDGRTYTALTANHVVKNPNSEFIIRTSKGKDHPVVSVRSLQENGSGPDLAIVTFETREKYAVAPLSDSDEIFIGSGIYISGYPLPAVGSNEREYAFTNGQISTVRSSNAEGYNWRYDAVTRRGMSGGPVFDVSGRVVGIHGQGETVAKIQNESGGGGEEIKTGFNAGIPINTFMARMPDTGIRRSKVKVDDTPPDNEDAEKVSKSDVDGWFKSFALNVGIGIIRRFLPF